MDEAAGSIPRDMSECKQDTFKLRLPALFQLQLEMFTGQAENSQENTSVNFQEKKKQSLFKKNKTP